MALGMQRTVHTHLWGSAQKNKPLTNNNSERAKNILFLITAFIRRRYNLAGDFLNFPTSSTQG